MSADAGIWVERALEPALKVWSCVHWCGVGQDLQRVCVVLNVQGREFYTRFYRGYSRFSW